MAEIIYEQGNEKIFVDESGVTFSKDHVTIKVPKEHARELADAINSHLAENKLALPNL